MVGRPDWVKFAVGLAAVWGGALLWLVMPFDPLPDVIPVLGWLDDLVVLLGAGGLSAWWAHRALQVPAIGGPEPYIPLPAGSAYDPVPVEDLKDW
jgi:hypothetical protein